ncbi:MAG: exo-alpha-sialidase [Alistipes sp.]|nr:exo-alpha-sialidase [Alistipes sp.]MBR2628302.1 exo-alpha-sialidase [Alistipes sp.]
MKRFIRLFILCILVSASYASAQTQHISYTVDKIWGNGQHCAFTSIAEFQGKYYVTFREAQGHVFDSDGEARGKIRILVSEDGNKWETLPLIAKEGYDLRDPKLSVTPDGRLMVTLGGSVYRNQKLITCEPHVMFSEDGKTFTEPQPIVFKSKVEGESEWLWRVTWMGDTGYGVSYGGPDGQEATIKLLKTTDGINYSLVQSFPDIKGFPNEATVRFLPDGRMAILLRRDGDDRQAMWGLSNAPFTEWTWKKTGFYLGGPDCIVLDDNRIVAAGRTFLAPHAAKTTIFVGDNNGRFIDAVILPSGGDTSYPGFITVGNELWVSYYSMHGTPNASIYLAKFPLDMFYKRNK